MKTNFVMKFVYKFLLLFVKLNVYFTFDDAIPFGKIFW